MKQLSRASLMILQCIILQELNLSRASHLGTRIILRSVSPESESIYDLIISMYKSCSGKWKELQTKSDSSDEELQRFLEYAAQFLGNCGNYKGFGDSKFIPRLSPAAFEKLAAVDSSSMKLFQSIHLEGGGLYANIRNLGLMHLGYPDRGHLSAYYPDSPSITEEEITLVGEFLAEKKLLPENTRMHKTPASDFEVLIASAIKEPPTNLVDTGEAISWPLSGKLKGKQVSLVFGDHREEMAKIALEMKRASLCAADETQKHMMEEYAASFGTGSMVSFLKSQKLWVKNLSPSVESNIGFTESYRDCRSTYRMGGVRSHGQPGANKSFYQVGRKCTVDDTQTTLEQRLRKRQFRRSGLHFFRSP